MTEPLGKEIRFAAGSRILIEGEEVTEIFEVIEGEVLISANDLFNPTGAPIICATLGPSDIIGEPLVCSWMKPISPYSAIASSSWPQSKFRAYTQAEFEEYVGDKLPAMTRILGRLFESRLRHWRALRRTISDARLHSRHRTQLTADPEIQTLYDAVATLEDRLQTPVHDTIDLSGHVATQTLKTGVAPKKIEGPEDPDRP